MSLANRNPAMKNPFVPAVKEQVFLRCVVTGPPGSGKTWMTLQMATAIAKKDGGKIAVIDTEGRSARRYAGIFEFDVLDMENNYDPELYVQAIEAAPHFGYSVLVIDSFSHAWNGPGGVLNIVDNSQMGNNKMSGWIKGRPAQDKLTQAILGAKIHILGTTRAKTEWSFEKDAKGKTAPVKMGVGSVQSSDFEYEFDVAMLLDMDHTINITKSRCIPLNTQGDAFTDAKMVAETMHAWATDGEAPIINNRPASTTYLATDGGKTRLKTLLSSVGADGNTYPYYLQNIEPGRILEGFSDTYLNEESLHSRIKELANAESAPVAKPSDGIRMFRHRLIKGIDENLTDAEICKYAGVSEFTVSAITEKHGSLPTAYDVIQAAFNNDMASAPPPIAKTSQEVTTQAVAQEKPSTNHSTNPKAWSEDEARKFESRFYLTYPDDADAIMDDARRDLEIEHWYELGDEETAWKEIATYCYDKGYKVVSEHVKLVKTAKQTFLLFQAPIQIRYYGHTSFKDVVGEDFYDDNALEILNANGDFIEIEALRIDEYKKNGSGNKIYYTLSAASPLIESIPDVTEVEDYFA